VALAEERRGGKKRKKGGKGGGVLPEAGHLPGFLVHPTTEEKKKEVREKKKKGKRGEKEKGGRGLASFDFYHDWPAVLRGGKKSPPSSTGRSEGKGKKKKQGRKGGLTLVQVSPSSNIYLSARRKKKGGKGASKREGSPGRPPLCPFPTSFCALLPGFS